MDPKLCETQYSITYQIPVLMGVVPIVTRRTSGGPCCAGSGELRRTSNYRAWPYNCVRRRKGICRPWFSMRGRLHGMAG